MPSNKATQASTQALLRQSMMAMAKTCVLGNGFTVISRDSRVWVVAVYLRWMLAN